jgi:hypothetical protein
VTIGDSVETIGLSVFSYALGLTSVTIGDSVKSIEDYAFSSTGLTSVTIGDSVKSIGESAFERCTGLTSVTIGDSVKSIEDYAFQACPIPEVCVPNPLTVVTPSAFEQTTIVKKGSQNCSPPSPPPPSPPPAPPPSSCKCITPSRGTGGSNTYTCVDGSDGSCASNQECFATSTFAEGQWGDACRVPRAPICTCESPSRGTAGSNSFHCEDGFRGSCAGSETCYATSAFYKGDWSTGCRAPQFCFCDHPASTGSNGYHCEDGHRGYCSAAQVCFASSFSKGDWGSACGLPGHLPAPPPPTSPPLPPSLPPSCKDLPCPVANIVPKNIDVSPDSVLGICEGDCDKDSDCKDGLTCIQRDSGAAPGCVGDILDRYDYCVPVCVGRDDFDAGHGGCSEYAVDMPRHGLADDGVFENCSEAGRCVDWPAK